MRKCVVLVAAREKCVFVSRDARKSVFYSRGARKSVYFFARAAREKVCVFLFRARSARVFLYKKVFNNECLFVIRKSLITNVYFL